MHSVTFWSLYLEGNETLIQITGYKHQHRIDSDETILNRFILSLLCFVHCLVLFLVFGCRWRLGRTDDPLIEQMLWLGGLLVELGFGLIVRGIGGWGIELFWLEMGCQWLGVVWFWVGIIGRCEDWMILGIYGGNRDDRDEWWFVW